MAPRKPSTPVDLDLDALAREANDDKTPFTFRIHGQVFSLASADECDFRVLDALDQGQLAEAIRLLLGDDQYSKFTTKPVSIKVLKDILGGWSEHKGLSLGE
jgi:hypothetical protein